MGIENLLLCSIFIEPTDDIPLYGTSEIVERNRLYHKSNDVGTSGYQTYLTDPQPAPAFSTGFQGITKPFVQYDKQGISFKGNSASYHNGSGALLGGLTNVNWEEIVLLVKKHFGIDD